VVSSFLSGAAPDLTTLIIRPHLPGARRGFPSIPLYQAILWEIFPFHQRGLAMAVWGVGFILGPILGPDVGGYLADEWSWRWIFYINLPVGVWAFLMASAFSSILRICARPGGSTGGARLDGRGLRVPAARARPRRAEDWFDSRAHRRPDVHRA
jgi:MFS family permease